MSPTLLLPVYVLPGWISLTLQWTAPEVRAGMAIRSAVVTAASDVYMVGGLAYELLTAGVPPFHWLARNAQLLFERLTSADPVEIPGTDVVVPGLLHKNVLEAAVLDRNPIPWCVQADSTPGSVARLEEVKGLMTSCLALSPEDRLKLPELHRRVVDLLLAEAAEVRATGSVRAGPPTPVGFSESVDADGWVSLCPLLASALFTRKHPFRTFAMSDGCIDCSVACLVCCCCCCCLHHVTAPALLASTSNWRPFLCHE
jgi:hypothetical protein